MVRTQIYLTQEEQAALEKLSKETGKAKSEIIRSAIDDYLNRSSDTHARAVLDRTAGMWRDHGSPPDVRKLRRSWARNPSR